MNTKDMRKNGPDKLSYTRPEALKTAAQLLREDTKACVMAGGTDLLGTVKERILPETPEHLVSLKGSGLSYIEETEEQLRIGAMATLDDIEKHEGIRRQFPVLREAARQIASPQIRHMATIGGNLCQAPRCWYYRHPDDRFDCMRKGGRLCNAFTGNNTYHSIFGAIKPCASACEKQCPNHTPIPAYFEKLRADDLDGAAKLLLEANLLAPVMGRVCVHSCQEECSRSETDESLSIHDIERFVGDHGLAAAGRILKKPSEKTGRSIGIVGAGAAGLSAAWHLAKAGHSVVVYDAEEETGGMLRYGIPAYRLPRRILDDITGILEDFGVTFRMGQRLGTDLTVEDLAQAHDRVLVCIGAWQALELGCPGENLKGVYQGIDFLKRAAEHRAPDLTGQKTVVIGAGNTAMDAARTAFRLGAASVDIISITDRDEVPATDEELEAAAEEGAVFHYLITAAAFLDDADGNSAGGMLRRIRLQRTKPREDGLGLPVPIEGAYEMMDADCVIVAIGQKADPAWAAKAEELEAAGIEIAGDFRLGPRTAIEAIADGREAAERISAGLGCPLPQVGFELQTHEAAGRPADFDPQTHEAAGRPAGAAPQGVPVSFDPACLQESPRLRGPERPISERTLYEEDRPDIDPELIKKEAARCYNCGCTAVSPSDLAAAVMALDGICVTTEREIPAGEFFAAAIAGSTVLAQGEILREIRIPKASAGQIQNYRKFRLREAIDFPVLGLASNLTVQDGIITGAKLVASGAAPLPKEFTEVADFLNGRAPDADLAVEASKLAIRGAIPLQENAYKIQVLKALVRRAVAEAIGRE